MQAFNAISLCCFVVAKGKNDEAGVTFLLRFLTFIQFLLQNKCKSFT